MNLKNILIVVLAYCMLIDSSSNQLRLKEDKILSELQSLQAKIEDFTRKDKAMNMKFSRLFENTFPVEDHKINIAKVNIIPSVCIPYKDNFYYSMMFQKDQDFFTLRGDLIISGKGRNLLYFSNRNDHTFFGETTQSNIFVVRKLKVANRQL